MSEANLERIRAAMPPDGTELRDIFVDGDGFPAPPGLFADDVPVRFVAPGAEGSFEGPEALQEGWADWLEPGRAT